MPEKIAGEKWAREYTVVKKLGQGSFGEAILVKRRSDSQEVVSKTMRGYDQMEKKEQEACLNEATLLSRLHHPYVTKYYETLVDDGNLCIIMEFAPNGTLEARIRKQKELGTPFPEGTITRWFLQLAVALKYIHIDNKILHRDLKPQNIFLGADDGVKLGDLGIAMSLEMSMKIATSLVGSPYYMSPELWNNEPYSFKSDMWAVGCIGYELATLSRPYEATNLNALVLKVVQQQPTAASFATAPLLKKPVMALLTKTPADRPSITALLELPDVKAALKKTKLPELPVEEKLNKMKISGKGKA